MTHEEKILDSIEIMGEFIILQKLPEETASKGGVILPNRQEHIGIAKIIKVPPEYVPGEMFNVGDVIWFAEYAVMDIAPLNERKVNKEDGADYPDYGYIKITDIIAKAKADSAYGQMIEGESHAAEKTT